MENIENSNPSVKELPFVVQILIGIVAGAGISGLLLMLGALGIPFTLMVFAALIIGGIVYGFCSKAGAAAMMITAEAGFSMLWGITGGTVMALYFVLPFAFMVIACERKLPFFRIMGICFASMGIGIILALAMFTIMFNSDVAHLITEMMRSSIDSLSPEGINSVAGIYAAMFESMGAVVDISDPMVLLRGIVDSLEDMLKLSMPVMLITLISVNCMFAPLTACYIRKRRGYEGADYVPVSGWRLPIRISGGILVLLLVGFILSKTSGAQGEVVFVTTVGIAYIACCVQSTASIYHKLSLIGVRMFFRILGIIFIVGFGGVFPMLYGGLSMLIGSHGITAQLRAMHGTDNDKDE